MSGASILDIFAGFDDHMEEKEPGYKARKAAERAEQERERLIRREELLADYGSEDAVFAETVRETLLREALAPLADLSSIWRYRGFDGNTPSQEMWEALARAYPLPETVQDAWAEYQEWEELCENRRAFFPDYDRPEWIDARQQAMARLLDSLRTPTVEGIRARLAWLAFLQDLGYSRDIHHDEKLVAALTGDFEALVQRL